MNKIKELMYDLEREKDPEKYHEIVMDYAYISEMENQKETDKLLKELGLLEPIASHLLADELEIEAKIKIEIPSRGIVPKLPLRKKIKN